MEAPRTGTTHELFRCDTCARELAPHELKTVGAGTAAMTACATCGSLVRRDVARTVRPLSGELLRAVARTFQLVPLVITLGVSGVAFAANLASFWLARAIEVGWLFAVLRAEAAGTTHPDVAADDIDVGRGGALSQRGYLRPLFLYVVTSVVAFLPAGVARGLLGEDAYALPYLLWLLGALYLPAALVVSAQGAHGLLTPFDVVTPFRLIARIPGAYFTAVAFLAVLSVGSTMVVGVLGFVEPRAGSIAIDVLVELASFIPHVAMARVLGTLMWECREEL